MPIRILLCTVALALSACDPVDSENIQDLNLDRLDVVENEDVSAIGSSLVVRDHLSVCGVDPDFRLETVGVLPLENTLQIAANGSSIAVLQGNEKASLWQPGSDTPFAEVHTENEGSISTMQFSGDELWMAFVSDWSTVTVKGMGCFQGSEHVIALEDQWVPDIAVNENGSLVVLLNSEWAFATPGLWSPGSGHVGSLESDMEWTTHGLFLNNQDLVLGGSLNYSPGVELRDSGDLNQVLATWKPSGRRCGSGASIVSLEVSDDGESIFVLVDDFGTQVLSILDSQTLVERATVQFDETWLQDVAVVGDDVLVTLGADLRVWDLNTMEEVDSLELVNGADSIERVGESLYIRGFDGTVSAFGCMRQ